MKLQNHFSIIALFSMMLATVNAVEVTIATGELTPGSSVAIPITADDAAGITAVAMSIRYDVSALEVDATSTFFQTATALQAGGDLLAAPFLVRADAGGLVLAGLRSTPAEAGPATLAILQVRLLEAAAPGDYAITIEPTRVSNAAAGYPEGGAELELALGATTPIKTVPGYVRYAPEIPDSDADYLPDSWEREHYGDLTSVDAKTDTDGDGQSAIMELFMGSNPLEHEQNLHLQPTRVKGGFAVFFPKSTSSGLSYRFEYSLEMQEWYTNGVSLKERPDLGVGKEWIMMEAFIRTADLPDIFARIVLTLEEADDDPVN